MSTNKLYVSLLIVVLLLVGNQKSNAQFFSMGIKGGVTSSNVFQQGQPTLGLTAGLMGEFKFIKWLRLRTEANFLMMGSNDHFFVADDPSYYAIGVPAMLQFMPFKNFHIGGGAEIDYLLASNGGTMPANRFNLGIVGHVEYRFLGKLGLGVRYVHNLGGFNQFNNIGDAPQNGTANPFQQSSLQATLSYSFGRSNKKCPHR